MHWRVWAGALVVLLSRLATMPRTYWEADEHLFGAAVRSFEPLASHPHPPGYPLYVGLGKFAAVFAPSIFSALVAISVVACVAGFVALALAFQRVIDDADLAVSGALLFYFGAAMLVHGTLPMSDSAAIACAALALYAMTFFPDDASERTAIGLGLASSAAIGIRPQLVVPLLPVFLFVLFTARDRRKIVAGLVSFGVLSLAWFSQLMDACGGWDKLVAWETKQAAYVAEHDAAASRGAHSAGEVASRFLFHPWGPKSIALPVLFLALLGAAVFFMRVPAERRPRALPILAFSGIHLLFALNVMDPADGPRYALPSLIAVSLLAALGLGVVRASLRMRVAPIAAVAVIALLSWVYVLPIVGTRRRQPSPGAAAAAFANAHFPANGIVLYDLSLRPQAEVLLGKYKAMSLDKGLAAWYDRPDVPLLAFGDGAAFAADAHTFAWPESDAYGKLTRNHYRVVTLEEVGPNERFLPLRGVYATERTDRLEWRWLMPDAALRLPRGHGRELVITFGLAHDVPYETNDVDVLVNGVGAGHARVARRGTAAVTVPLPAVPDVEVTLKSVQSFAPAGVLHNQDPRILAVQLLRIESR
jgi:hypothetical protein